MEYCELGDLKKYIKETKDGYLPEEEVKTIIFQLAECLDYMHKEDVVHRDLKPNVRSKHLSFYTFTNQLAERTSSLCTVLRDGGLS